MTELVNKYALVSDA